MNRYTERDEFGNADIKGVESQLLYENLMFDGMNRLTNALNKLAAFEDLCEELNIDGPKGPVEALRQKIGFIRFSDGYDEENQKEIHSAEFIPYYEEYLKLNKKYVNLSKEYRTLKKKWKELKKYCSECKKTR